LAEECVDVVFRKLGRRSPPCLTADEVLPGAVNFSAFAREFTSDFGERLLRVYGSRAGQVVKLANDPLTAEVVFAFKHESAKTLGDCFLRRTMIGLNGDLGLSHLQPAADIGMRLLGWSDVRAKREVEAYRKEVEKFRLNPEHPAIL